MSIPPLVCSTPPPPDQCEDDKDPEDFDIHYNLSQEDDYDYGSFSTYNHFQSAISVNKPLSEHTHIDSAKSRDSSDTVRNTGDGETSNWSNTNIQKKLNDELKQGIEIVHKSDIEVENVEIHEKLSELKPEDTDTNTDKKTHNEEDLNIEDLNLTIEDESLSSNVKNELYDDNADSDKSDSSDKEKLPHIPDTTSIITSNLNEPLPLDEITSTSPSIDDIEDPGNSIDDLKIDEENVTDYVDIKDEPDTNPSINMTVQVEPLQDPKPYPEALNEVNNETDDEFGDFNDFHTASNIKPSVITSIVDACENPWGSNQTDTLDQSQMPQSSDFEAFEAHFEDTDKTEPPPFDDLKSVTRSAPDGESVEQDIIEDDDDFGDFDDFKSSVQETEDTDTQDPLSRVPVLDFQTPESESQLLENINKILNSIFEEEIPEPESMFDGSLEGMLCETWGHLLETDVRQPYIVNWNSSIGQKTLLKALCIDSRNILFGPKWSYNMPKYAANLSAAPLQPQKQATLSGQTPSEATEKHITKPGGTWSDPFTADGQEFTYAEALLLDLEHLMATLDQMAHNHSTLKISELLSHACNKENNNAAPKRPSDLDVFNTDPSSKSEKIYSSTLDVQPIRQINLPDTHIFTPTDSETPRSKTIHYSGPSFLSQTCMENDKNPPEEKPSEPSTDTKVLDDADYSDFQDFKGSFKIDALEVKPTTGLSINSVEPPTNASQLQPSTSAAYSVGILQPIKIEPIMPTLNWPSPGEVKETFDDFTEFASSTSWNNDVQGTKAPCIDSEKAPQIDNNSIKIDHSTQGIEPPSKINDSFDDDFDTFQSALPSNEPTQAPPTSNFSNFAAADFSQNMTPVASNQQPEQDFVFPKIETKSDPISFTKSNDILNYSETFMHQNNVAISVPKVKETIAKATAPAPSLASPLSAVLQPTTSSSQIPQNSAQILQPLSLESFSQINWPNPGINLQDLSRFNPVETLNSLKSDLSVSGNSKGASPVHSQKASVQNQLAEDDMWGEFVSSKPNTQQQLPKKTATFADDDEWSDFVSSPTVKPQNGLNTISLNVHTNLSVQKSTKPTKQNRSLDIPITHYITPKSSNHSPYNDIHFQNL